MAQTNNSGIHQLNGTDNTLPNDDLKIFDTFSQYEGVGIGESAHGVKEYMKMQTRLIKYFVQDLGFRQIYLESEIFAMIPATEYIRNGTGSVEIAIKSIWNPNLQYVDMLNFLRDWNINHPTDKVELLGTDIYELPYSVYSRLKSKFENSSEFENDLKNIEATCVGTLSTSDSDWAVTAKALKDGTLTITDADFKSCMDSLNNIKTDLLKNPQQWKIFMGIENYYEALLAAQVLRARENYMKQSWIEKKVPVHFNFRDQTLSENILIQRKKYGETQKFLWIAHTSHTSKATSSAAWWNFKLGDFKGAGEFLNSQINYASIGMTGFSITGQDAVFATPTSNLSYDLQLHNLGHNTVAVDTNGAFFANQPSGYFQNENSPNNSINGVFLEPSKHFNSYIYFDQSAATDELK